MKLIFYDFEVFYKDWMVVLIEYETKEKIVIINDKERLDDFYKQNKDDIWIGYNSRMYDQFILKGILLGMNPYDINTQIIDENKNGYQVIKNAESITLNNFDISTGFHGLKQLEAFMGSKIKETSIPFDIKRKLSNSQIQEVVEYCTHDVLQTIEVFNNRKEEFDSQLSLIQMFNLPMSMFNKTKAQLSAYILGATKSEPYDDEFNISIPDTLQLEKYKHVLEWYKNPDNLSYIKELNTVISDVPHTFAWGGLHGSRDNYSAEGIILCMDVASLYPSLIIEYNYMSRNVVNPLKYKEIRDTRLRLKKEKNPMQAPLKIVLNATYGCMKDKHNPLYDPLMANNVCIAGQLLLLDLIEKVEPYCELIQSNTDGLFLKVDNIETVEKIKLIASEWEKRTRLNLEWDIYNKIYQKDVNNYIIINEQGKYKSKGAYVKKLSNIDYDLPIVNKSLVNYFINNKPIEDTINECGNLREFQKVVKVSTLYKYAILGDKKLPEKVLRVFASKDEKAPGVFKVKSKDRVEKIANTPERCFIWNENVNSTEVPEYLDRQYYIDIATKRLSDFLNSKSKSSAKAKSDIKGINAVLKEEVIEFYENYQCQSFVDFLIALIDNTSINKTQIETMIKLNFFSDYGYNLKLLKIFKEFKDGENQYKKTYVDKTKQVRIAALKEYEDQLEDEKLPMLEQFKFEEEMLGVPQSTYDLPKTLTYITDVNTTYSPKLECYCIANGKTEIMKIDKKTFKKHPVQKGNILQIIETDRKPRRWKENEQWVSNPNMLEWWIVKYAIRIFE
jgi:hypothetical protein